MEKPRSLPRGKAARNESEGASLQFPLPYLTSSEEEEEQAEEVAAKGVVDITGFDFEHLEDEDEDIFLEYTVDCEYLDHLLELTEAETELDSGKTIPNIFNRENQFESYSSSINSIKKNIIDKKMLPYVTEFTDLAEKESLMVGKIPLEEIEKEELRLRSEALAHEEKMAVRHREKQDELAMQEERAKKEITKTLRKRRKDLRKKEAEVVQSAMLQRKQVFRAFKKAEQQLKYALNKKKGEVKTFYGNLERVRGRYDGIKRRWWRVNWSHAPQPVQIKIGALRGVRDKLPAGRYVLLASLCNRLGGHTLKWSKLKGQHWGRATTPEYHQGNFYNTDIKFDQSIYTVLPSRHNVRPSMVLTFELFVLKGEITPTDKVIAWGAFPICDAGFNIIEGKYKCPFLRGPVDPCVTQYRHIGKLIASDLESWLGNLYFQVLKLPKYVAGMNEYEVDLQFTSHLLGDPSRVYDSDSSMIRRETSLSQEDIELTEGDRTSESPESHQRIISPSDQQHLISLTSSNDNLGSHLSSRIQSGYAGGCESSSSSNEEEAENLDHRRCCGRQSGFKPVSDHPGLRYKVHTSDPLTGEGRDVQVLLPVTPTTQEVRRREKRSTQFHSIVPEEHTMAVCPPPYSASGRRMNTSMERVQYVGRQFLSEISLSQWRSLEFWSMLVILVLSWWFRLYIHYTAQFAYLRASNIPVNRFKALPHTVVLNYQSSLLLTQDEVAIVLLGPFSNVCLFCLLILISWVSQKVFGSFPDSGSLLIAAYGIQALLDPYWIFIIDMALLRFRPPQPDQQTADSAKLYWNFFRLEGSGVVGAILTIFLYIFVSFTTLACLYMYLLRVHMNGRLIDIYHRLKGKEESFFLPRDMEVSFEELTYVCRKAEQWRGTEGERRKTAVWDYVWEEEHEKEKKTVTTYISIHTLHLDGMRELYRHFLRLDNGSIIEIFGALSSISEIGGGVKNALVHQNELTLPTPTILLTPNEPGDSDPFHQPGSDTNYDDEESIYKSSYHETNRGHRNENEVSMLIPPRMFSPGSTSQRYGDESDLLEHDQANISDSVSIVMTDEEEEEEETIASQPPHAQQEVYSGTLITELVQEFEGNQNGANIVDDDDEDPQGIERAILLKKASAGHLV